MLLNNSKKQAIPIFTSMPSLPGNEGWAGMYAGESKGILFCFGGANFPEKKPWEGGNKVWHNNIFMFKDGKWIELKEKLPFESGYGISVSYKGKIILAGGNNQDGYSDQVIGYEWNGDTLEMENYPKLPFPLAHMCGTLLGDLIIIAGGHSSPLSESLNVCLILDLSDLKKEWVAINPVPGPGRLLSVCAAYEDSFYVFSGETALTNNIGKKYRHILQDAYCLTPVKSLNSYKGEWKTLSAMPKGVSAGPSPLPVIANTGFVFWGGIDAVTALWKDPVTHPGISSEVFSYDPEKDTWNTLQVLPVTPARVTLPVVNWNGQWIYISGETRPGIRTNSNYSIR